jgi:hypothetical protein
VVALVGGGEGGGSLPPVGGLDVVLDSVGGVDGPVLGGGELRIGVVVEEAEIRLGCGDGLAERSSRIGRSWPCWVGGRTIDGLSGVEPAPPPSFGCVGLGCCELTAAGVPLVGVGKMVANWAPSHIAGPRPTATMAPKSANGPRSIARHPLLRR